MALTAETFHARFKTSALLALPALALPLLYVPLGRHWVLSNALALSLATAALAFLRLDSFPTAFALLGALLAYDIFWVFCTPVMVAVARGIDAPIKLQAPKTGAFAMLGLGDVVVPGLMIALCLRFDLGLHALRNPRRDDIGPRSRFAKTYFATAMVSYVLGLVATVVAMNWQGRAQPALLYLSPACSLGPLALAAARGELGLLMRWRDEADDKDSDDRTIEKGSEVAMRARAERKAAEAQRAAAVEAAAAAEVQASTEVPLQPVLVEEKEDESWMETDAGAAEGQQKRKPRRRGGKKK